MGVRDNSLEVVLLQKNLQICSIQGILGVIEFLLIDTRKIVVPISAP